MTRREIICGIYKITNKINNKGYIGQSKDILSRWQSYRTTYQYERYKTVPIHTAFNEFGIDNFDFEIICRCSKEELNYLEEKYIKKHNTCIKWVDSWGYNIDEYGNNTGDSRKSKSVRCITTGKIYESANNGYMDTGCYADSIRRCCNKGAKTTKDKDGNMLEWEFVIEESKIDKIIRLIKQYKNEIPNELYVDLNLYLEEIGKDNSLTLSKTIICQFDLEGVFIKEWESKTEIAIELNVIEQTINKAINGKILTVGKYILCKKEDYENGVFSVEDVVNKKKNYVRSNARKIVQLDINDNYMATFNSLKTAQVELGLSKSTIPHNLSGKNKRIKNGSRFIYFEDYEEDIKQNKKELI